MSTTPTQVNFDVKNLDFADLGKKRIDWANQSMKVLQIIRKEFIKNQPLKGIRISACLRDRGTATQPSATAMAAPMWCCARQYHADDVAANWCAIQYSSLRHQG
jgi:S-adenosylhomocysteine hydrolase